MAVARGELEAVDRAQLLQVAERLLAESRPALERVPRLKSGIESYLREFEDRCLDELKLESLTLRDDPLPLGHRCFRQVWTP